MELPKRSGRGQAREFSEITSKSPAVFENATFGQGVGLVFECFQEMEQESLGLAFFVALEFGGELSEGLEALFQ
jgi:hypothetical protein